MPVGAEKILETFRANPSFLMIDAVAPHKGHAQALSAFELFWSRDVNVNLVIVSKQGWVEDSLIQKIRSHPELDKRLFWFRDISDEYLGGIYSASTCLIVASEVECFGHPLIEAAQNKTPIIARDIPLFREVAGIHACYFSGMAAEDLAAAISRWLELYQDGQHPASDNLSWLTWKESAENLQGILLNGRLD